jgi:hypothetical protein
MAYNAAIHCIPFLKRHTLLISQGSCLKWFFDRSNSGAFNPLGCGIHHRDSESVK